MGRTVYPFYAGKERLVLDKDYVTYDLRVLHCTEVGYRGDAALSGYRYSVDGRPYSYAAKDEIVGVISEDRRGYSLPTDSIGVVAYRPDLGDIPVEGGIYSTTDMGRVIFHLMEGYSVESRSKDLVIEVGRKYVNHIGEPVRILATDVAYPGYPVLGLYKRSGGDEGICRYTAGGHRSVDYPEQGLFEVPEKYNKDDLVQYIDESSSIAKKAYYSHYEPLRTHAKHVLYSGGRTSKTTDHTTFFVKDIWPAK